MSTEAQKRYAREWYYRNVEKVREYQRTRKPKPKPRAVNLRMYYSAKTRAQQKGVPFDLTPEDIGVPEVCPVLGIPLRINIGSKGSSPNSPTLDRLVPSKGYVKGNVVVMSARANFIKQDAGSEEILKVGQWLKEKGL